MKSNKYIAPIQVPTGNLSAGIGYVIIPKNVEDIEKYIKHCYLTGTISIHGGYGHNAFYDVAIDEDSLQAVIFPKEIGEQGSPVVWVNIPKHNKPVVVAVLRAEGEFFYLEEHAKRITRVFQNNAVDITLKAKKGALDISVVANNENTPGKINIRLVNDKKNCEFNVFTKGVVKFKSTGFHQVISDEKVELVVMNDKGEEKGLLRYEIDKGLVYEDQFKNSLIAKDGEVTFVTKNKGKIILKEGKATVFFDEIELQKNGVPMEPGVLGDKNAKVLTDLLTNLVSLNNAIVAYANAQTAASGATFWLAPLTAGFQALSAASNALAGSMQAITSTIPLTKSNVVKLS